MALKKLPIEIQSRLNAAAKIRCFNKAVEEMVYNSLDAEATSIAIRINIYESFIQVVDNGFGIPKSDIPLLGQRYTSSKNTNFCAFKSAPNNYGFHGESLSNLVETSKCVKITTRLKEQEETWVKCFCNGQYKNSYLTRMRPSKGTTVEVKGFLYNLHIPKEATNELKELEKIKSFLKKVALVRTNISLSIRDNYRNEIIFKVNKNRDFCQTLFSLFKIEEKDLQELQIEKNHYKAKGYIGKQIGESNSYRWMYLNGRFIYKSVLHDIINSNFMTNKQLCYDVKEKHYIHNNKFKKNVNLSMIPTYFIFISCPYFDYEINFTSLKTIIEFNNWTLIEVLLEKLVKFYKGDVKIKEIEVVQPKTKRKLENTKEEVKRIMEKVLGTKSTNEMHMCKGVKGKIVKKKLKNRRIDKLKNKIKNELLIQKRATEYKASAHQKKQLQLKKRSINVKKKTMKDSKDKIKSKLSVISGNRHHVKEVNSVVKKAYKLHRTSNTLNSYDMTDDPLNDNVSRKRNFNRNNKVKLQKPKPGILSNKNEQFVNINQNDLVSLQKVNNVCLKSSDLVKTVLNSQKGYSSYIDMYYKSKHAPSEYMGQMALFNKTVTQVRNVESNISTTLNAQLTFESHRYRKDNTIFKYYQNNKKMDKSITEKPKDMLQNHIKMSVKDITTNRRNKKQNLYKNIQYSKCDDLSQVIEFTDSSRTVSYFKTFNNESKFTKQQSTTRARYRVSASIQNTYTIVNPNLSIDIASYPNTNNNKTSDEFQGAAFPNHRKVISTNNLNETENCNVPLPEMNKIVENNIQVIFISNSENSISPFNMGFEPLNLCEAVYQNTSIKNKTDINVEMHEDETWNRNDIHFNQFDKSQTIRDGNLSQPMDKMENVSHHFGKIYGDPNMNMFDLTRKLNQGHDQNIEPPGRTPNCINYETKSMSNKFELQNRHNFMPKGMSPIFENCQTKNICSYNLEMDYFEDDLYHNFANDVLDNFKTYEKGITNVNDINPEKLNRDLVSLKFSAQSLSNAKVFGQVDKKFILAELHSDSLNTKHLVLFDQHAVHERILLENNLSDYKNGEQWSSVNCENLCLKLPKDIILYMNNFKEKIEQFGLRWRIDNECVVTVSAVPKALFGKHYREPDIVLSSIKSLILEEIKSIKSLGGNILLYPKSIMDLVFSEACRYAIKFGDKLSKTECASLISSLSNCKTPFQCAHGRPVMAVLMDLKYSSNDYKVDKSKVLKFRNKTMR